MIEPGDIIQATAWDGRTIEAFVVELDEDSVHSNPVTIMIVRQLSDGALDAIDDIVSCQVLIKRYHILAGLTIQEIEQELYEVYDRTRVNVPPAGAGR